MIRPDSPLPLLTGLGVNVRATIPGYPTTAPDGHRRWILGHDDDQVVIDEDHQHGVFIVHAPDLPGPLSIDEADIARAAAGVANLIQARLHEARQRHRARLELLACLDEPTDELLAVMVARALRGVA